MTDSKAFIDTNVLLYLLSSDSNKADQAEAVVQAGGKISVQVLNEFTNVARRKLDMTWMEISEVLTLVRSSCPTESLTTESHDMGRLIAERYQLSVYDAMIVSSALLGNCNILYSEDMQHDLWINDQLRICNPFMEKGSDRSEVQ